MEAPPHSDSRIAGSDQVPSATEETSQPVTASGGDDTGSLVSTIGADSTSFPSSTGHEESASVDQLPLSEILRRLRKKRGGPETLAQPLPVTPRGPAEPVPDAAQQERIGKVKEAMKRFNKKPESDSERWGVLREELKKCRQGADQMEKLKLMDLACEDIAGTYPSLMGILVGSTSQAGRALFGRYLDEKCPVPADDYRLMELKGFPLEHFEAPS